MGSQLRAGVSPLSQTGVELGEQPHRFCIATETLIVISKLNCIGDS